MSSLPPSAALDVLGLSVLTGTLRPSRGLRRTAGAVTGALALAPGAAGVAFTAALAGVADMRGAEALWAYHSTVNLSPEPDSDKREVARAPAKQNPPT